MTNSRVILKRALAYVLVFALAFTTAFTGTGFQSNAAAKKVTSIKVAKTKVSVQVGKTSSVKVTVKGTKGATKFTAKSSKKAVATVKVSGKKVKITGKKKGKATITVTTKYKNKKGKKLKKKIKVTVNPVPVTPTAAPTTAPTTAPTKAPTAAPVNPTTAPTTKPAGPEAKYDNVVITTPNTSDGSTPTVSIGTSTKLTANVDAADADKIVWSSSNPSIVVVDSDGTVTGASVGQADAIATMNGKEIGRISINISAVAVTGITLDKTDVEITVGSTATVTETVTPADATNKKVTWTTGDASVATVSTDGIITAVNAGSTTVTATTVDGNISAVVNVTVKSETHEDVDKIEASVTNSLEGFPGTVLVGTNAKVDFTLTGSGAGGATVIPTLTAVSGYTDMYKVIPEYVTTSATGKGSFTITLKDDYKNKYNAKLTDSTEAAFASFQLTLEGGGATQRTNVNVCFAQIACSTDNHSIFGGYAMDIDNNYDSTIPSLEPSVMQAPYGMESNNKDGYIQEYVPDQQTTAIDGTADHSVYFEAAPQLIVPAAVGDGSEGKYEVDLNLSQSKYGVYQSELDGNWIKGVPGGLESLNVEFSSLKLSPYSRLIIRAYNPDTMEPIIYMGNLVQYVITPDKVSTGSSEQIGSEVFNDATDDLLKMDLLVFIESAGQINEEDNVGYTITKASGTYKNQETKDYELISLPDSVEYSVGAQKKYTTEVELPDPDDYIPTALYKANDVYCYTMPAFPDTGDAIITAYTDDTKTEVDEYFLYPTETQNNSKQVLAYPNKNLAKKATVSEIKELKNPQTSIDEFGRFVVNSTEQGYVHVNAAVDAFGVKYDLTSYVAFTQIPIVEGFVVDDFFAVAGQMVTLVATAKDKNGGIASEVSVKWNVPDASIVKSMDTKTDSKGQAKLVVMQGKASDIEDISVSGYGTQYSFSSLTVGGVETTELHASIHWVMPGVYFKSDIGGAEYNTAGSSVDLTVNPASSYEVSKHWLIGTKVAGVFDTLPLECTNISNIKINLLAVNSGADMTKEDRENGVCSVISDTTGDATITASLGGLIDPSAKCLITVFDGVEEVTYTSVGDDSNIAMGKELNIPVTWTPSGQKVSVKVPNNKFSINNGISKVKFYIITTDKNGNPISADVDYKVVDKNSNVIVEKNAETVGASGLLTVEIPVPTSEDEYVVTTNLTGKSLTDENKKTIKFTDETDIFTVSGYECDGEAGTITIKFTKALDENIVSHTKFYEISDGGIDLSKDITGVQIDNSDASKLILTIRSGLTFSNSATVNVHDQITDGDYEYYFTNTKGKVLE